MIKHFFYLFLGILAWIAPQATQAQMELPTLPKDTAVRIGTLPNGLTYYIRHNEWPKNRADFYIAQKVGSMQENDNQRGLAHFLEHMCFNGTKNFKGNSLITYLETIGVKFGQNLNAYTNFDETVYNIADVPTTSEGTIDSCLLILSDWADGLLLLPEEIDKERGVIKEEWRMTSSPIQRIFERQLPTLYPNSKYGHRLPIGLMSIIETFKPEVLRAYYEKWYRPDLQGVIVVGDINVDDIERKIKTLFSDIKMPENPEPRTDHFVHNNEEAIVVVDSDKEQTNDLIFVIRKLDAFPNEQKETMAYYGYKLITSYYSALLNLRLSELSKKADCPYIQASAGFDKYLVANSKASFTLTIVPKEGKSEEAVRTVFTELERVLQFGFTTGELSRVKNETKTVIENLYNNRNKQYNSYYVNEYVQNFINHEPIMSIAEDYNLYNTISPHISVEAVNALSPEILSHKDNNLVIAGFYPQKEGVTLPTTEALLEAVHQGQQAKVEAYVDNVKADPLIEKLPKPVKIKQTQKAKFDYTCWTLSNGCRVFWRKTDFTDGKVSVQGFSVGGKNYVNTADLPNAYLLPNIINANGIGNFTSTELEKKLAGIDAYTYVNLNDRSETINGGSSTKDLRTLFELIYLRFGKVKNDPDAYNYAITSLKTQLENANKKPEKAFIDTIMLLLHNNDPRSQQVTLNLLQKVDYEGIKRLYQERFASIGDFDFVFTGDFNVDSLRLFTETYLATLPGIKKRETEKKVALFEPQGKQHNEFTRAMESPKGLMNKMLIGDMAYTTHNIECLNALGEILTQRINTTIREEKGWAYAGSANGSVSKNAAQKERFTLQIYLPIKPEKADSALLLINEDLEKIAKQGVTEEELSKVKEFNLKEYNSALKTNGFWSSNLVTYLQDNLDNVTNYPTIIKQINSQALQKIAQEILSKGSVIEVIMRPQDNP